MTLEGYFGFYFGISRIEIRNVGGCNKKDQSDLVAGGIALTSSPKSSFLFAKWQQQFAIACIDWGLTLQISFFSWGQEPLSNTVCSWIPQVYLRNGIDIRLTV